MTCETSWYQEGRIILTTLSGDISAEELQANDTKLFEMLESSDETVHIMADIRNVGKFPTQLISIKRSSDLYLKHDHMGVFVVIGMNNPIARFLSNVISQMAHIKLTQVDDVDHAIDYLQKHDSTLLVQL